MSDVMTAPSALGELPCIGWELNCLSGTLDDIWGRYALASHEVAPELERLKREAARLNDLVRDIERQQRRAA